MASGEERERAKFEVRYRHADGRNKAPHATTPPPPHTHTHTHTPRFIAVHPSLRVNEPASCDGASACPAAESAPEGRKAGTEDHGKIQVGGRFHHFFLEAAGGFVEDREKRMVKSLDTW